VDLTNVAGSVLAGTERTSIQVKRHSVNARSLASVTAQGTAETRIEVPSSKGHDVSIWGTFDGYLGDSQVAVRAGLDGKELDFAADVLRAKPEAVRALWPLWPIQSDVSLHLESKGVLPDLATQGSAVIGDGVAHFSGAIGFEGGVHTTLAVDARGIDLRSLAPHTPPAILSASGTVNLAVKEDQKLEGTIEAKTEPFSIEGIDVANASVRATINGPGVSGKATVHDPALPSQVDFDVHPGANADPVVVGLEWTARAPEIARIPWLKPAGHGQASWHAKGQIVRGVLDARVDGSVARFARPGVALGQASVSGSVHGPLDQLAVSTSLHGQGLQVGPLYFPEVKATAQGPLTRLTVTATTSGENTTNVSATATVEKTAAGARLGAVAITAQRDDVTLSGKVGSIEVAGDRVELKNITVQGAGEPISGSITVSPSSLRVHGSSKDTDLKKLAAVLLPGMPIEGRLTFDVDADLEDRTEKGHVRLNLKDGIIAGLSGLRIEAEGDIENHRFSGGVNAQLGELGSLTMASVDAELAGPMLRLASWRNAAGKLQVDTTIDLDRLSKEVPIFFGPADVGGKVRARLLFSREDLETHRHHAPSADESPPPDIDLVVWTNGLRAEVHDLSVTDPHPAPRFASEGVDVQLGLHLEGETQHGQLTARLVDHQGLLAGFTALGDVPLRDLWLNRSHLAEKLAELPLTAHLALPRRAVASYPAFLRPSAFVGDIEGAGMLTGSVREPVITLNLRGYKVQPASAGLNLPVDIEAEGTYDGAKAVARVRASRPEGVVLDARTEVKAPLQGILTSSGSRSSPSWEASGSAKLFSFPLASIPALSDNQVAGLASGTLTFTGLNSDPEIAAQIDLRDVKIDRATFPHAVAVVRVAEQGIVVSAKLDQPQGGASATASARVKWTSPLFPEIDRHDPLDLFLEARDFRAAALYPLLFRGIFTYFDGRLNGTLHLHQETRNGEVAQTVDGAFDLRDGVFQIPEIGQEFRKAQAHILVTKSGEVTVNDVSASGVSGRLTAAGSMALRGFSFVSAEGTVRVAKKEAVPLTVEGVSLGEAYGTLFLHAKMSGEHKVKLDIDVPTFHTDMPESSSREVRALSDRPDVKVGMRRVDGDLLPVLLGPPQEKRSEDALEWHMTFYLGQDVRLRRGTNMDLVIGGQPVVDLTDEAHVSGSVDFRSGTVEVFGKRFEIEHGSAKFEGDEPGNPNVSVTARWDAPDGTRIYVDYVGPLRNGVLTLRSEPALSRSDILAILLFGGNDATNPGTSPSPTQGNGTQTGGLVLAGGAATTKLNRVLSSVSPLDITTRVTSDSQSATPEVAVQLSPKVKAQVSYRTRAPNPGEKQDRVLMTLDWRFRRNWSIATTVGDQGSSILDLIWQYRY
jgi:translocation and assembly module TamB